MQEEMLLALRLRRRFAILKISYGRCQWADVPERCRRRAAQLSLRTAAGEIPCELEARTPGAVETPQAVRVGRVPVGTDVDRADLLTLPAPVQVRGPGELQEARLVEREKIAPRGRSRGRRGA